VLADAAAKMLRAGVKGPTLIVELDPLGDGIMAAAKHFSADLMVMGTHGGRGRRRLVLGSVAERFLRISTRPVLLVPLHSGEKKEPRKVSTPGVAGASI
jgi:nucleotide-binding universal stress UspA family protein